LVWTIYGNNHVSSGDCKRVAAFKPTDLRTLEERVGMERNPNKRQVEDLLKQGEKIGELLGLERVPTHNMTWKERRLDLPNKGECYPLIDVLEKQSAYIDELRDDVKMLLKLVESFMEKKTVPKKKPAPKKRPASATEI
jgi:hypothetical protein